MIDDIHHSLLHRRVAAIGSPEITGTIVLVTVGADGTPKVFAETDAGKIVMVFNLSTSEGTGWVLVKRKHPLSRLNP